MIGLNILECDVNGLRKEGEKEKKYWKEAEDVLCSKGKTSEGA